MPDPEGAKCSYRRLSCKRYISLLGSFEVSSQKGSIKIGSLRDGEARNLLFVISPQQATSS